MSSHSEPQHDSTPDEIYKLTATLFIAEMQLEMHEDIRDTDGNLSEAAWEHHTQEVEYWERRIARYKISLQELGVRNMDS